MLAATPGVMPLLQRLHKLETNSHFLAGCPGAFLPAVLGHKAQGGGQGGQGPRHHPGRPAASLCRAEPNDGDSMVTSRLQRKSYGLASVWSDATPPLLVGAAASAFAAWLRQHRALNSADEVGMLSSWTTLPAAASAPPTTTWQ